MTTDGHHRRVRRLPGAPGGQGPRPEGPRRATWGRCSARSSRRSSGSPPRIAERWLADPRQPRGPGLRVRALRAIRRRSRWTRSGCSASSTRGRSRWRARGAAMLGAATRTRSSRSRPRRARSWTPRRRGGPASTTDGTRRAGRSRWRTSWRVPLPRRPLGAGRLRPVVAAAPGRRAAARGARGGARAALLRPGRRPRRSRPRLDAERRRGPSSSARRGRSSG